MDTDSQGVSQDLPQPTVHGDGSDGLIIDNSDFLATCSLCRRNFSPINELTGDTNELAGDYEVVCGDCKFLLLEDYGNTSLHLHRRVSRGRRNRHSSSESTDYLFSQQFSQMIDMVRQAEYLVYGHENEPVDGDAAAWLLQHSSSHTTPSGSRRWPWGLSDTESDGFDNLGSLYGENESNISFGGYRGFHGDSDVISFSTDEGNSDASGDGRSFLNTELEDSELESNTDIDPMCTGSNLSNFNDQEEDEDEEEEAEMEGDTVESIGPRGRLPNSLALSLGESIGRINWHSQSRIPEYDGLTHWRFREDRHTYTSGIFVNDDRSHANAGDYLDGRRLEELLEHLVETDRRGAPSAATSFVNGMPRMVIEEEHVKQDTLACAICKDLLSVGTEVNQLPCFHVYHPSCILPWLSTRNSCPLCRFELPTDDKCYEGKHSINGQMEIHEVQLQGASEDSDSDVYDGTIALGELSHGRVQLGEPVHLDPAESSSGRGNRRGRWFVLAAAPIVSLVGVVLMLWVSKGRGPIGSCNFREHQTPASSSPPHSGDNLSRRSWALF